MSFDHLRSATSNKNSPIGQSLFHALQQKGEMSIRAMREVGFRSLAPLADRAQLALDAAVMKIGRDRLSFVNDILNAGLTYKLPDALSYTMLEWQKENNRVGAAQRSMSPGVRQENKLPDLTAAYLPIYITSDGFSIDVRTLKMSQRLGHPLDTTIAEHCVRSVNEGIEDAALNGATTIDGQELKVGGYAQPGLLNAPNANTKSISVSWLTATGAQIYADVIDMINTAQGDHHFGPYNLYVGTQANMALDADYSTAYPGVTIRERLLKIQGLAKIGYADLMPAKKVALIEMSNQVVDIVDGIRPTVIPYTSLDGFQIHNVVMAIQIPRFRSDSTGESGIVIGTWA